MLHPASNQSHEDKQIMQRHRSHQRRKQERILTSIKAAIHSKHGRRTLIFRVAIAVSICSILWLVKALLFPKSARPLSIKAKDISSRRYFRDSINAENRTRISIAYVGNSILFVNDCRCVLQAMLEEGSDNNEAYIVEYDACLTAGATLVTLWDRMVGCTPQFSTSERLGGSMLTMEKLLSPPDGSILTDTTRSYWDYVILHDQTRAPAFSRRRRASERALNTTYAPKILRGGAIPILMQTAAYRNTEQIVPTLGSFESFTKELTYGYQRYADVLNDYFARHHHPNIQAVVAPVGQAYADLKVDNVELYDKLYMEDDVHPSPYGTWLQACILYIMITGSEPPPYNPHFWNISPSGRRRTMLPVPNTTEANALRKAAWKIARRLTNASHRQ